MRPIDRMAAIFNREVERLDLASQAAPLDPADLTKLKLLADAYRKIHPTDPDAPDDLEGRSTAELLEQLHGHPARDDAATQDQDGAVEAE